MNAPGVKRVAALWPALAVTAGVAILGVAFFQFISDNAVNVLFLDQWDFLSPLFQGDTGLGRLFFHQHGPHREGLGLIADGLLYPLTSWNARAESFLIGACIFAAMLLALLLKHRLAGRFSFGDVAIPLIFLTLEQYETLIAAPNAAYGGIPLVLIMLYCLSLLVKPFRIRYALCLLLNFLLIFTGFGVFMGVVTIGMFALEGYWRLRRVSEIPLGWSLGAMLLAGISMGSFFFHYTFWPAVDCFVFPYPDLLAYPRFLALLAGRFLGIMRPIRVAGVAGAIALLPVVAIAGWLVRRVIQGRRFGNLQLIAAVLLGYSILFALNAAIGRVCLGFDAAQAPRYATLLIPGVTACYLYLQTVSSTGLRRGLTGLFILLLLPGCVIIDPGAGWIAGDKRAWAECYLRTEDISGCDKSVGFSIYPRPEQTHLKEKLDYLKKHRLNLYAP